MKIILIVPLLLLMAACGTSAQTLSPATATVTVLELHSVRIVDACAESHANSPVRIFSNPVARPDRSSRLPISHCPAP